MPRTPSVARKRWTALVAQHADSGQTLRAFARDHGVNANSLAWWRGRLRREARDREAQKQVVDLVELRVEADDPDGPGQGVLISLERWGAVVRVDPNTDLQLLRVVLGALC